MSDPMTAPHDPRDLDGVIARLSKARRAAILRTEARPCLLPEQSARGTLSDFGGQILDWSFRPARFTPLGLAIRARLGEQT